MYAAWTFAGSCRENTVSGVLLVAGGILVAAKHGRGRRSTRAKGEWILCVEEKGMLHRGDTDLRACASALQRALLRLTGVRAGFSFSRRNGFSIGGGRKSGGKTPREEGCARGRKIARMPRDGWKNQMFLPSTFPWMSCTTFNSRCWIDRLFFTFFSFTSAKRVRLSYLILFSSCWRGLARE